MGIPLLTTGSASNELVAKASVDTKVTKAGDTMTGNLSIVKSGAAVLTLTDSNGYASSIGTKASGAYSGIGARSATDPEVLLPFHVASPTVASHATSRAYVDAEVSTRAYTHTHPYAPSAHDHTSTPYKFTINNAGGLTIHYAGQAVASIGAFNYSGTYGLRFIADWQGDSGGLAPLQIGSPIDGNSAARVDWVQGDRASAGHTHTRTAAGYQLGSIAVGSLAAGTSYGPWGVGHGLPNAAIIMSDAVFDDGVHSVDTSCGGWDGTNVNVTAKNNHTAGEDCTIVIASFW